MMKRVLSVVIALVMSLCVCAYAVEGEEPSTDILSDDFRSQISEFEAAYPGKGEDMQIIFDHIFEIINDEIQTAFQKFEGYVSERVTNELTKNGASEEEIASALENCEQIVQLINQATVKQLRIIGAQINPADVLNPEYDVDVQEKYAVILNDIKEDVPPGDPDAVEEKMDLQFQGYNAKLNEELGTAFDRIDSRLQEFAQNVKDEVKPDEEMFNTANDLLHHLFGVIDEEFKAAANSVDWGIAIHYGE